MTSRIISGQHDMSVEALGARSIKAAHGFKHLGVGPNDAVALLLRNDFAFFEASSATGQIGAYSVPINWYFTGAEVSYILADCNAKVLVVHAEFLPAIKQDLPADLPLLIVETHDDKAAAHDLAVSTSADGAQDWNLWLEAFDAGPLPPTEAPNAVFYTSGTTGKPKGVRREAPTAEQAAAMLQMAISMYAPTPDARTQIIGPMYHNGPYTWGVVMLQAGAEEIHLAKRFDAEGLLRAIEEHRLTHLFLVPTMFVWLLKLPKEIRQKYDVSSLQHVVHAAAPCSVEVKRQMIDWWGPVIAEFYGSTETTAITFCNSEQWLAHPGTVGCALDNVELRIISDSGDVLPAGEVGTIYARNFNCTDFTYIGAEQKRQEVELDGLVTAGDIGYLDQDGFLFLCDRKNDMVISGGVNIYPAEIEACLVNLQGVMDCAVFGIPDDEYGESLVAIVQQDPAHKVDAQQVTDYVAKHLAKYKVPKLVEFVTELPREDSGKIMKRKLRDVYWQNAGRSI
jgi:long-chain acyl-CoA synthetase